MVVLKDLEGLARSANTTPQATTKDSMQPMWQTAAAQWLTSVQQMVGAFLQLSDAMVWIISAVLAAMCGEVLA